MTKTLNQIFVGAIFDLWKEYRGLFISSVCKKNSL